jgi:poly-gamma-glutamate capsule biosynthesis protein CapA/YwtB (metallophosphatase superfamily)
VRIGIVGDVMLGRRVGERAARLGAESVTALVDELLAGADLVCGNLEAPFCGTPGAQGALRADPSSVAALRRFDVLNLANNHIGDCGDAGVDETLATLRDAGIRPIGVGGDEDEALAPAVLTKQSLRVGFIGCAARSLLPRDASSRHAFGALESPLLETAVGAARAGVDALVVSVHAGNERVAYPPPSVRARLSALCRAGADVVVTHHPHVLGGYERLERSLVWHSLGDFVFDGDTPARRRGGLLRVDVGEEGVREFTLVPTHLTDDLGVAPAPEAVAARVRADVERVTRALAAPDYRHRYPLRYARALLGEEFDRVRTTYRREGPGPAVRKGARLARFAPQHALNFLLGRFR